MPLLLHSLAAAAPALPRPDGRCHGKGVARGPAGSCAARWKAVVARSISRPQGCHASLIENGVQITKWPDEPCDLENEDVPCEAGLQAAIDEVRAMLSSVGDGEISISAYDTAWVALVPRRDGGEGPLFPASVEWIIGNQLPDGSWGDAALFSAYDRLINTLACVTVLTSWGLHPDMRQRGLAFLQENMWRLGDEDLESMPIGFEIAFPSLIELAKSLSIDFPYDHPVLQDIYAIRDLKLKRIPRDVLHKMPTSLLHSLEGMPGLEWEKLLKLQSSDGSFLFSPSATAYALMQTGDIKCFEYLERTVTRFNGGVPNVYPVDMFEHIWIVDRLERLGISRYFQHEIKDCIDYIHRYWSDEGICWARNSAVHDVDDTAMGFRVLRLHGYNVSPSVFKRFEKDGEFVCFAGQSTQAVTGMYNLNRASQVMFPGEDVLQRARVFSQKFLRERQAAGALRDKWIIAKDLPGEVGYTLDFPWYGSLPRVEVRTYLEQYGGKDDIWIGKTLYRMPLVNNDVYLQLARDDFNRCQVVHQLEWHGLERWYDESELGACGVTRDAVLRAYFLAAASAFEPNRAPERLGWARAAVLADAISAYFDSDLCTRETRECLIRDCLRQDNTNGDLHRLEDGNSGEKLAVALRRFIDGLAQEATPAPEGQDYTRHHLQSAWMEWLLAQQEKDSAYNDADVPPGSYMETGILLVQIIEICAGRVGSAGLMTDNSDNGNLNQLTSSICRRLCYRMLLSQDHEKNSATISNTDNEVDLEMQELAQCVLRPSGDQPTHGNTKHTYLSVVKSFYYAAHCPPDMLEKHISKVIFEPVGQLLS